MKSRLMGLTANESSTHQDEASAGTWHMRAVLNISAGENHRMIIGGHLRDFAPGEYAIKRRSQLPTRMVLVLVQRTVVLCKRTSQTMHVRAPAATTLNGEATRSVAGRHAIGTG